MSGPNVMCLQPKSAPGCETIIEAIENGATTHGFAVRPHLERREFIGLLKRLASDGGVLVGNSSAGLIEASALRLPVVDIGPRQNGRECPPNVIRCSPTEGRGAAESAMRRAMRLDLSSLSHPYGDGRAGERIARVLAGEHDSARLLRTRRVY